MDNIKQIVAQNITELRKGAGMTQLELAELLSYSDKAVSKWERGDSLPDIVILKQIADHFHVTVDYLIEEDHPLPPQPESAPPHARRNRKIITGISILLVLLVATMVFVILSTVNGPAFKYWLSFLYAVPASMIVALIFNSLWFGHKRIFLIISVLMWSVLACVHITLLLVGFNIWLIYILGIPGQAIILLWSGLNFNKRR